MITNKSKVIRIIRIDKDVGLVIPDDMATELNLKEDTAVCINVYKRKLISYPLL